MERIAVIGISGSGKSTFSVKLSDTLKIPITHLDKEYYNKDWSEKYSKEDWKKLHGKLISKNRWIIDGTYRNTLKERLKRADTIIYFDIPKWRPFLRVFKRVFRKSQAPDKPLGMKERVSLELIKFMLNFPKKDIEELINNSKIKLYIFKNNKEADDYLEELTFNS